MITVTGIPPVAVLPWGSHICMFYDTPEDLIEAHIDYFRAGLANNQHCVWAYSEPVDGDRARAALRELIPDFDGLLSKSAIELIPGYDWYLQGNEFDPQRITGGWRARLEWAVAKGFDGMRVSGNAFGMEANLWDSFREYEEELNHALVGARMIVLCTYSLRASRAMDFADVVRAHHFSVIRRKGRWEYLETPELAIARHETGRLDNLVDPSRPSHDLDPLIPASAPRRHRPARTMWRPRVWHQPAPAEFPIAPTSCANSRLETRSN